MTDEIRKIEAADKANRGTPEERGAIRGRRDYGIDLRLIGITNRLYPGLPRHDDALSYGADPVFLELYEGRNYSGIKKVRTAGQSGIQHSEDDNAWPRRAQMA